MRHCKIFFLALCIIIASICFAMIIRINIKFPKAEDISYTLDNPANIEGVIVTPIDYSVWTVDEFSKLSNKYSQLSEERKKKSRVVVLTISVNNTTDEVAILPGFVFVAEELNAFNGTFTVNKDMNHSVLLPKEIKEIQLCAYIGPALLDYKKMDELDSSTITLVYSFYPYRRKLVFNR